MPCIAALVFLYSSNGAAAVGKSFIKQEFGTSYFYKSAVYYDGGKWIETLAGNRRNSFQNNIVSPC